MYCYLAVSLTVVLKVTLVIIEFLLLWATRRRRENVLFAGEGCWVGFGLIAMVLIRALLVMAMGCCFAVVYVSLVWYLPVRGCWVGFGLMAMVLVRALLVTTTGC